jgi:hypothetical protein
LNGNIASANKRILSGLRPAMRALIHCSGWTRAVLLTSKVTEHDVAVPAFPSCGYNYQRHGGNVRAITGFALFVIHLLQS